MSPNPKRTNKTLKSLVEIYREDMQLAILATVYDGRERGFHIWHTPPTRSRGGLIEHSPVQVGNHSEVELKELFLPSVNFVLVSFHTHNGEGNDKPSPRDVKTALALGEDLLCIGCVKDGKPHISCWKINVKRMFKI